MVSAIAWRRASAITGTTTTVTSATTMALGAGADGLQCDLDGVAPRQGVLAEINDAACAVWELVPDTVVQDTSPGLRRRAASRQL
jgi:hypothetical protein